MTPRRYTPAEIARLLADHAIREARLPPDFVAADVTLYPDGSALVTLTARGDTCTSSTASSYPSEQRRI